MMRNPRRVSRSLMLSLLLTSCRAGAPDQPQQAPANVVQAAQAYLQQQENLSQRPQVVNSTAADWNPADLCQTLEPTQPGYGVTLQTADALYRLHTNQDGSRVELCAAELDSARAAPYTGPGYTVIYPSDWTVIDEGFNAQKLSQVRFVPRDQPDGPLFFLVQAQAQTTLAAAANATLHDLQQRSPAPSLKVQPISPSQQAELTLTLTENSKPYRLHNVYRPAGGKIYRLAYQAPQPDNRYDQAFATFVQSFQPLTAPQRLP